MAKRRLLWIGSVVPEEEYKRICSLGYRNQQASRIAQLNIIRGLEKWYEDHFDFVSGPALPGYPRFRELWVRPCKWKAENGVKGQSASYLNIEYVNRLLKARAMKIAAQNVTKEYSAEDEVLIFVNSPHTPFMQTGIRVKKKYPKAKLILVIPDLPQFMESRASRLKKFLKEIDIQVIRSLLSQFDYYVLYSSHMREHLGLRKERCVTMEGCATVEDEQLGKERNDKFTFMYSGKTDIKFGLDLLVDAFQKLDTPDCSLIITGDGDASTHIKETAAKDTRIQYYGFIDDYSKVKEMQRNADVLMNMRLPEEQASKYCFPSKLFEYMKSGNPVISFRLGGIGEEYYEHLLVAEENSAEGLAAVMRRAMTMSGAERDALGMKARNFIKERKNYSVQTKLIYDLIEGVKAKPATVQD